MKKLLVAIVALMTSLSTFAGDLDLFFKAGASISKFNLEGSENRTGIAAGIGGKFHITDSRFFIMPQLMYAQKGQDNEVLISEDPVVGVAPVLFHMIEAPILFGANFDLPVKDLAINAGVGPYIAYDFRFNENNENMKYLKKGSTRRLISHGDVGVSLTFEVQYKRLVVFYDYDLGLRDATQNVTKLGQSLNHRSMRIGAGYTFPTLNISKQRKKRQM